MNSGTVWTVNTITKHMDIIYDNQNIRSSFLYELAWVDYLPVQILGLLNPLADIVTALAVAMRRVCPFFGEES